jgi:hypothetical protein
MWMGSLDWHEGSTQQTPGERLATHQSRRADFGVAAVLSDRYAATIPFAMSQ